MKIKSGHFSLPLSSSDQILFNVKQMFRIVEKIYFRFDFKIVNGK